MKRITLIVLAVLTGIYLLVCAAVYFLQKRIIFLPSYSDELPPPELKIQDVYYPTADGQILHAWWMPVDSSEFTLLFFHGNAGCVEKGKERMEFFRELGYSTLMIDYRGYGKSTGKINREKDIYEDALASLKYVADSLKVSDDRLIVWGWSLGGAVTTEVIQNRQFATVVLEGTFNSMDEIASNAYPIFPTRCLLKYHFRSGDKLPNTRSPLFFIHSVDDNTIPFEQGKKLFEKAPKASHFLEISGSHNHGYYENKLKIIEALRLFIRENAGKS